MAETNLFFSLPFIVLRVLARLFFFFHFLCFALCKYRLRQHQPLDVVLPLLWGEKEKKRERKVRKIEIIAENKSFGIAQSIDVRLMIIICNTPLKSLDISNGVDEQGVIDANDFFSPSSSSSSLYVLLSSRTKVTRQPCL